MLDARSDRRDGAAGRPDAQRVSRAEAKRRTRPLTWSNTAAYLVRITAGWLVGLGDRRGQPGEGRVTGADAATAGAA